MQNTMNRAVELGQKFVRNVERDFDVREREERAIQVVDRLIDLLGSVIPLHESNRIFVFSNTIREQIPRSYAANTFTSVTQAMIDVEMARLLRLWDNPSWDCNSISTAYWLTRTEGVRARCTERAVATPEMYLGYRDMLARKQEARWRRLDVLAPSAFDSGVFTRLQNARNKYIAHSLQRTGREKAGLIIPPAKYLDQRRLLLRSIRLVDLLDLAVRSSGFDWRGLFEIARRNASALWSGCSISVRE